MKMTIISSNIRFDNPKDEHLSWRFRKDLLSRILRNHSPDLIGTQEGRLTQLRELQDLLPEFHLADKHRHWIEERMYPCIFFNAQNILPLESGDIWLSETPHIPGSISFNSAFPRLATWLKGTFKKNQRNFFFANLHLDHVLPETREKQIEVFIEEIEKLGVGDLPFILSGDFNESPSGMVRTKLMKELYSLYDPWTYLKLAERTSHHGFSTDFSQGSRIDWILLNHHFKVSKAFFDETAEDLIYPSDHFPLITEVEFR